MGWLTNPSNALHKADHQLRQYHFQTAFKVSRETSITLVPVRNVYTSFATEELVVAIFTTPECQVSLQEMCSSDKTKSETGSQTRKSLPIFLSIDSSSSLRRQTKYTILGSQAWWLRLLKACSESWSWRITMSSRSAGTTYSEFQGHETLSQKTINNNKKGSWAYESYHSLYKSPRYVWRTHFACLFTELKYIFQYIPNEPLFYIYPSILPLSYSPAQKFVRSRKRCSSDKK